MYVSRADAVIREEAEGMEKVWIQWLIAKEQGAENFAMRLVTVAPGGVIPKHDHPWEHEIFILRGRGVIGAGGEEREVSTGNFAYVEPSIPHWYRNTGDEDWQFICVIPYLG